MRILARPRISKLALAVSVVAVLLLAAAACGGGGGNQVTGLVLETVDRSLTEVESLRLRDDEGRVWEFFTQGPVGTTGAHLRQHQLAGEKVRVTYRDEGGRLIASNVRDVNFPGG